VRRVRAVLQRVAGAHVTVDEREVGRIGLGLLVLLGIAHDDTREDADWLLHKLLDLRIFENEHGKFDRSLRDVGGAMLVVSQFTLLADTGKGRRPSFSAAARPEQAVPLYEHFVSQARAQGGRVATGEFGAHMQVHLINDGPVTFVLDSRGR
jgi:D-tyrosyl-tRNA(Tyr) deacylase